MMEVDISNENDLNDLTKEIEEEFDRLVDSPAGESSMQKDFNEDRDEQTSLHSHSHHKKSLTDLAEMNPELYGLRRSGRSGVVAKVCDFTNISIKIKILIMTPTLEARVIL
jgi:hypothetical protein